MQDEAALRAPRSTAAMTQSCGPSQGLLLVTDVRFWRQAIGSQKRVAEMVRLLHDIAAPVHVLFIGRPNEEDDRLLRENPEWGGVLIADPALPQPGLIGRTRLALRAASGREENGSIDWLGGASAIARSKLQALRRRLGHDAKGAPTLDEQVRMEWVAAFCDVVSRLRPATLVIEYVRLTYLLDALDEPTRKAIHAVVDTHDVMWRRDAAFRQANLASDLAIDARTEAMQLRKYDAIIAIQSADAAAFREMVGDRPVHVVHHPNVIDPLPPAEREPMEIAFVASGMSSNVDALRQFLQEIWPQVSPEVRRLARIVVYGGVCTKFEPSELPEGVELRGFVADLRAAYQAAAVVINPVLAGGGLKIKTVESLCYGRCLITTPCGGEGLEDGAGSAFLVATSGVEFASHLASVLLDSEGRSALAMRAMTYARKHLARDVVRASLANALSVGQKAERWK